MKPKGQVPVHHSSKRTPKSTCSVYEHCSYFLCHPYVPILASENEHPPSPKKSRSMILLYQMFPQLVPKRTYSFLSQFPFL